MSRGPRFVCLGGAAVDRKFTLGAAARAATSNPATAATSHGGVARNVAENLARLGDRVALISALGEDADGRAIAATLAALGIDVSGCHVVPGASTAQYVAVLGPGGGLEIAVIDMAVLDASYDALTAVLARQLRAGDWLFADCNAPADGLRQVIALAEDADARLALDAISVAKAKRLPDDLAGVDCLFLNSDQAASVLGPGGSPQDQARALMGRGARCVVLTLGAAGAIAADPHGVSHIPAEPAKVRDVTGAGDSMIAGVLHGLARGLALPQAVMLGSQLAARTVATGASVDTSLSPAVAEKLIDRLT